MTKPRPHPEGLVCAKHPTKPRRWKRVHHGKTARVSVCSVCVPARGGDRCIHGHVGHRGTDCYGVRICHECRRVSVRASKRRRRGLVRGIDGNGDPAVTMLRRMDALEGRPR